MEATRLLDSELRMSDEDTALDSSELSNSSLELFERHELGNSRTDSKSAGSPSTEPILPVVGGRKQSRRG